MAHEESTSLEEINKQRIALGLKPLTDDKSPEDSPEKRAEDNYAKQREKEAQEREEKYVCPFVNLAAPLTCGIFQLLEGSRIK
jgi:U4/U6.U5 tri-snRNP-associated protein 1